MIVWLASYPRSGNTLLRTILKRCFDLCSYADEPVYHRSEFRTDPNLIGHIECEEDWDDFYGGATESSETILVKTHLPPRDEQPFLYVVRDGRAAIRSYRKFYRDYHDMDKSLLSLIVGDDVYGDWTTHFANWNKRTEKPCLVLFFEELINLSDETLVRVSQFLDYTGAINPWINPINQLRKHEPNFFSKQSTDFVSDEEWTIPLDYLFNKLHGELMYDLKYYETPVTAGKSSELSSDIVSLLDDMVNTVRKLVEKNSELLSTCNERLQLINKLQDTCVERLELINLLHCKANETED